VKDQGSKDVKKLQRSLCHISAQNSILQEEVRGLRQSLAIKERRPKKSFTLQLDEDEVYHGGAKIWSPRSVQRARDRRVSQQQQQELEKLQKAEQAEASKAARNVSFNLKLRGVLSGRRVGRRLESGRPQRKPKESIVEASATLPKLYNCPNQVSAKLQNLTSQLQSVKSVVVLL
jgi:hypothetical protein